MYVAHEAAVGLIDAHLVATHVAELLIHVRVRMIRLRGLQGVLRGDAAEVLPVLAQVPHRLAMVLRQKLQLLLVLADSVAHVADSVADLVKTNDQVVQAELSLLSVLIVHEEFLLDLAEV